MIDLDLMGADIFDEGLLNDAIRNAGKVANVSSDDINAFKQVWDDDDKGIVDALQAADDNIVKKVVTRAGELDTIQKSLVTDRRPSIIARAKNSILQFPVYITQGIRVNEAHIISKVFERVYATYVQTAIAQNPMISPDEANNLVFLRRFHTNVREAVEVLTNKYYEAIDDFDEMMQGSIFHTVPLTENCTLEFRIVPTDDPNLIKENARLANEPLSGFKYLREDDNVGKDVTVTDQTQGWKLNARPDVILSDAELQRVADYFAKLAADGDKSVVDSNDRPFGPADDPNDDQATRALKAQQRFDNLKASIIAGKRYVHRNVGLTYQLRRGGDPNNINDYDIIAPAFGGVRTQTNTVSRDKAAPPPVDLPRMLRDADIRKINGLLPYTMEVTFRMMLPNGGVTDVRYIVGIKTILHPISVSDLGEDLHELIGGEMKSLRKVRYKTGELSFKDYIFDIKNAKKSAANRVNYEKRWLNTLKRIGQVKDMTGTLLGPGIRAVNNGEVPVANGTMVLSQPEVVKLAADTGIDLSDISTATKLASTLSLIGVVIIDATAGTMKVLFPDSDNRWDIQSISSIDAEIAKTDNSQLARELNRMINK